MDEIRSQRLGEGYLRIAHPSGLTLLLCPMAGFSSAYALFATNYGSIDAAFRLAGEGPFRTIPAGTAHFLEHKMFESEDGQDVFARYAATGASANAYTSFDKTAYLFGCSENFEQSLEILLDFVTHPYFTPQTVAKEQGIIGQEIRMYDDDPDWRVLFNLLGALYHNHPIAIDIAGTAQTIAQITADSLYDTYRTFYNLHNMVLAVAGNFSPETAVAVADRVLHRAPALQVERAPFDEPETVRQRRVEQALAVSTPLFNIGFKAQPGEYGDNVRQQVMGELALELALGEGSPLYRRLYDAGLINATFNTEVLAGPNYLASLVSGESRRPDELFDRLLEGVQALRGRPVEPEAFERARRACYGRYVAIYGGVESMAGILVLSHFSGVGVYEPLELLAGCTPEDCARALQQLLDPQRAALSVIRPAGQ